jgi:hypothetical protein
MTSYHEASRDIDPWSDADRFRSLGAFFSFADHCELVARAALLAKTIRKLQAEQETFKVSLQVS